MPDFEKSVKEIPTRVRREDGRSTNLERDVIDIYDQASLRAALRLRIDTLTSSVEAVKSLPQTYAKVKHLKDLLLLNRQMLHYFFGEIR